MLQLYAILSQYLRFNYVVRYLYKYEYVHLCVCFFSSGLCIDGLIFPAESI